MNNIPKELTHNQDTRGLNGVPYWNLRLDVRSLAR
jgi:hypothetical protein